MALKQCTFFVLIFQELEQQRLERIQQVSKQSDVNAALDTFAERQTTKEDTIKTKEEIAAENREQKLRALQAKLRKKQERAEAVRRKKLSVVQQPLTAEEEQMLGNRNTISDDTPIRASVDVQPANDGSDEN